MQQSREVPASLIAAVNAASAGARGAWFAFLAFTAYLFIAIAGVTHADLLLNAPVSLPILQVDIALSQFFLFAPILFVFLHFGVLFQHVSLAQKYALLNQEIEHAEAESGERPHPVRFEIHSYFVTQAAVGPSRGQFLAGMLDYTSWLSMAIVPVLLLLYFLVSFLPYHDALTTWAHRVILLVDLMIICVAGIYFASPLKHFWHSLARTITSYPARMVISAIVMGSSMVFAFLVATIPDSPLDRFAVSIEGFSTPIGTSDRRAFVLTNTLFEGGADSITGRTRSLFSRSLIVTDADLVAEDKGLTGEVSLNLRGRDLRYATLDRSDLHGADLTGATLQSASLQGTRLEDAMLIGADLRGAAFWKPGQEDADFVPARLARANFRRALMHGANLHGAHAHGANFSKASLAGAVFLDARLQGADFQHADLVAANFTGATLDGARLTSAKVYGANFAKARLVAADLMNASLIGVDFRGADLSGADMRSGQIWLSTLPSETDKLDLRYRVLIPPGEQIISFLKGSTAAYSDTDFQLKMTAKLAHILKADDLKSWMQYPDHSQWTGLMTTSSSWDKKRLNQLNRFLSAVACSDLTPRAAVANGIARRGGSTFLFQPSFNGDVEWLFRALKADDCRPTLGTIEPTLLQGLRRAARLEKAARSANSGLSVNELPRPPGAPVPARPAPTPDARSEPNGKSSLSESSKDGSSSELMLPPAAETDADGNLNTPPLE
ncbi:MAG: pentapeptide repeat-containing protein [Pseudomonadota bacterium]